MALFRRRKPLHQQLAEAGNISLHDDPNRFLSHPPGWDGLSSVTEPALHGIPRPRRWDTVVTANAPRLRGDVVHFVALPEGTLVVDENESDMGVDDTGIEPLAAALEQSVDPPYRAEAVRRRDGTWAVAATRIAIVEEPGLDGEELELTVTGGVRMLVVDGERTLRRVPALEAVGDAAGPEYAVRARHVDGALWEVEATPL
jgi:hypothetical protein